MKKIILFLLLISLFLSCKKNNMLELEPIVMQDISAERLWQRIKGEQEYKKYSFWPGHEGEQPGQSPHGNYHMIFINPTLRNSLPLESKTAPYGSIIVKENCDANKVTKMLTVMAKVEGYSPETNDWFYAKFGLDGEVLAEGNIQGCVNCHKLMQKNDYIFVRQLDKPLQ